jgi:hypothetical protein
LHGSWGESGRRSAEGGKDSSLHGDRMNLRDMTPYSIEDTSLTRGANKNEDTRLELQEGSEDRG